MKIKGVRMNVDLHLVMQCFKHKTNGRANRFKLKRALSF